MRSFSGTATGVLLVAACFVFEGRANAGTIVPERPLQTDGARIEALPLCDLRDYYLGCERRGSAGRLPFADVPMCSFAYELLKRRAFGGDWRRMNAWARNSIAQPNVVAVRNDWACGEPA